MKKHQWDKIRQKQSEIYTLEPNSFRYETITQWYKKTTAPFKTMPFLYILPLSGLIAIASYLLLEHLLVNIVSLLQYGF